MKFIEVGLPLDAINQAAAWAVIVAQMVDDPTTYLDALRGDAKLKRKADFQLKDRRKVWEESRALFERAQGTTANVPEPGPEPTR